MAELMVRVVVQLRAAAEDPELDGDARQQRQHDAGGDHADGGLHRGAADQPDAVHQGAQIADVERGLVAVEADIGQYALRAFLGGRVRIASNSASGMRTKPSDRGGFIGSSFRRSADLAAPEGGVIGGEVAVRDPEVPLQLDGIARSQRH